MVQEALRASSTCLGAALCVVLFSAAVLPRATSAQTLPTRKRLVVTDANRPKRVSPEASRLAKLAACRTLLVDSDSVFLDAADVEKCLGKTREFAALGVAVGPMVQNADLVLRITRTRMTTHFHYQIVDQRSLEVLAKGEVSSLFGTASGRIAKQVTKLLVEARLKATTSP